MRIKIITGTVVSLISGLMAIALPEITPKQTAGEMQEQKDIANQASLQGAPEDTKTPLKLFESYFAGVARIDASEFNYFTKNGIAKFFDDPAELTAEDRKKISDGSKEIGERGHSLLKFWYHADAEKPSIVFGYSYLQNGKTAVPVTRYQEVKLDLIKTEQGWRIDRLTEIRGW
jgi:hypothetical protein